MFHFTLVKKVVALYEAFDRLDADYLDFAAVVELRYFGGWTLEHIATGILAVPLIAVRRRWAQSRTLNIAAFMVV